MIEKKTSEKPYQEGLIGKEAKIKTNNQTFEGRIILETKNTITIETADKRKKIIKKNAEITINQKKVKGTKITKRTEDRIKTR